MIELILEVTKYLAIMLGTSAGLNLILKNKLKIPFEKHLVPYLPLTVLLEEFLFRTIPFGLLGFLTNDPRILIGVSTSLFALVHLPNLRDIKHTTADTIKYLTNIAVLGGILGYIYMQHGLIFTFAIHLIYDFLVVGVILSSEKINKWRNEEYGRLIKSPKRI